MFALFVFVLCDGPFDHFLRNVGGKHGSCASFHEHARYPFITAC
jgi:hypothetical protein